MATTKGKFLTRDEKDLCEKIAALNIVLVSQRAQALLLLNDGHTQAKSCELSSLTLGQLRYVLRLFKQKRINFFPEDLFLQKEEEVEIKETVLPEPEVSAQDVKEVKKDTKKKKKKKKAKKSSAKKKQKSKKGGKKKSSQSKVKKGKKDKKKKKKK